MSQQQAFTGGNSPVLPDIQFVQGDTGGPVGPDPVTFTIFLVGDNAQGVFVNGNAGTFTEVFTVQDATAAPTALAASKGVSSYYDEDFIVTSGFVQLNSTLTGTVQTVDAATGDAITFPLGAVAGVYTFDAKISGFTTAGGPLGAGYTLVGAVRTDGASATLLPSQALDSFEEGALSAGTFALVVSGNNAILRVTGTAGTTINWKCSAQYVFVS